MTNDRITIKIENTLKSGEVHIVDNLLIKNTLCNFTIFECQCYILLLLKEQSITIWKQKYCKKND